MIFVMQGLSFSELSTSSHFLLDPYSGYVGVNISLNISSSLSFLNVYASSIRFSSTDGRTDSFSPSILFSSINLFIVRDFNCHYPVAASIAFAIRHKFEPDFPCLSHGLCLLCFDVPLFSVVLARLAFYK